MGTYNGIQLLITTKCNLHCPYCTAGIHLNQPEEFMSIDEIQRLSVYFQGLENMYVSGGEPTLHPDFDYISEHIREWYNPKTLYVWTNSYVPIERIPAFRFYDHVNISKYVETTYPGARNNQDKIDIIYNEFSRLGLPTGILSVGEVFHMGFDNNKGNTPCSRKDYDLYPVMTGGRIYPCCVSPGIITSPYIIANANWLEQVKELELKCGECVFGGNS
jgi:hypothetical protein